MTLIERGSSLAGIFSAGLDVLQASLGQFYHRNDLHWNEVNYYLQVRQVRIDIFNNIREDLQDIFEKDERDLDTNLLVVTLTLGFGFGFAVEGTFPEDVGGDVDKLWRLGYVCCAALSLVCPFGAMLGFLECRTRVIYFMKCYNRMNSGVMTAEACQYRHEAEEAARMTAKSQKTSRGLPRLWPALCRCRRRQEVDTAASSRGSLGPGRGRGTSDQSQYIAASSEEERIVVTMGVHADYLMWWNDWIQDLYRYSKLLRSSGVTCNVLCCALLLGLYFSEKYPDTPAVWAAYVAILISGLLLAGAFSLCIARHGPRAAVGKMKGRADVRPFLDAASRREQVLRDTRAGDRGDMWDPRVPKWMAKPLLQNEVSAEPRGGLASKDAAGLGLGKTDSW